MFSPAPVSEPFPARLAQARWAILSHEPFIGYLVSEMPNYVVTKANHPIETACTDYRSFTYNEAFCGPMSLKELTFVVLHEGLHVLLAHGARRGDRDPDIHNIACDHVINLMILDNFCQRDGIAQMPCKIVEGVKRPVGFAEPAFRGKTAEEVYDMLMKDIVQFEIKFDRNGQAKPGKGNKIPEEVLRRFKSFDPKTGKVSKEDAKQIQEAISAAVGRAMTRAVSRRHARGQGSEPSIFERMAEEGFQAKTPWHLHLRKRLVSLGWDNLDWSKPHKKYLGMTLGGKPLFMPRRTGVTYGTVAACIDTSGSITAEELGQFIAELNGLLGRGSVKLHLYVCDAGVHYLGEFSSSRRIPYTIRLPGGGGTDFRPAFEAVTQIHRKHAITMFVYFTDTWGTFPEQEPPYDTLWIIPDNNTQTVPFGTAISIPLTK